MGSSESRGTGPLRQLWKGWTRIGRKIGDIQARLLLSIFYFAVVAPFALAVRCATDPLALKARTPRGWRSRPDTEAITPERARQQF